MSTTQKTSASPAEAMPRELEANRTALRRSNVRTGLILASVALAFALGFVAKAVWLGH